MVEKKKKIVILGGGYGGVECTRKLEEYFKNEDDVEIVLISEDNFLLFTPMLPQVAAGMLATRHIVMPIRTIVKKTTFYEGRVKNIDPYGKIVNLWGTDEKRGVSIHYDFLVVSLGSETNFFGMSDLEKHAYTMKTLNDAMTVRNRVIDMLEQAENEPNPILRESLLTLVIVGGGFAGIETAGELMDLLLDASKYYPKINKNDINVVVLEALPNILPGFDEKLAKFAHRLLNKHGIEIKLKTAVTSFDGFEIKMKKIVEKSENQDSETEAIQTRTVIWTAGVTPVNTIKRSMFKTERGKIIVNDFLEVSDFPGVFAIGDCALFLDPKTEKPFAPTAQLAEAQAKTAAYNLHSLIRNEKMKKFEYESRGQMAIIGKRNGVASIFGMNISGIWAWFLWRNVYLSKIPRWDKRLRVFLDWTIDLFFDRDISRLKFEDKRPTKEYKVLDEVDDVW
ncbi:MAG: NAD(P)/FAD-dependent oxidoreductase [Nitrosopumilaceae archaeon]|uniref:NAD(P)/FAD-dependent oxidoreductase n=3 Tax=Candidatus Nitrosomaritimum aestuariumsis TaxID=3342354 RepID=A0AC60W5R2_9ARCH|nr:NAD(P)/FAD-dependent oxidoreductase [Nitrosopumilaceae archaeon]MBA4454978.1 NAD(P)/FAD-dependent oxidoreductase [Nitrosopumilaceae archaeon]MBA4461156.1 NAD(P)/FAD-dependent oxidoreductase [Nitrosopumilaceae archaeon]MBA4463835.1 NAD(P)/FAD-dependent oxidoreductase [Nitrosopumilaceae archaeon]